MHVLCCILQGVLNSVRARWPGRVAFVSILQPFYCLKTTVSSSSSFLSSLRQTTGQAHATCPTISFVTSLWHTWSAVGGMNGATKWWGAWEVDEPAPFGLGVPLLHHGRPDRGRTVAD